MPKQPVLIVGCGDIGQRILRRIGAGRETLALVRTAATAETCIELGAESLIVDLDGEYASGDLPGQPVHVLYLAPPPRQGDEDARIRRFLQRMGQRIERLVLISTTGVYGDSGGDWIDETTTPCPGSPRAMRRLDAEQAVREWSDSCGGGFVILRVPGIYAADRLPLARLKRGEPVIAGNESPITNRIHADDLADICLYFLDSNVSGEVVNVCDGNPTTMTDYFNSVADACGIQRPPEIPLDQAEQFLSAGMLSYVRESRRIDNRKLTEVYGIKLHYPSLKDGLAELAAVGE